MGAPAAFAGVQALHEAMPPPGGQFRMAYLVFAGVALVNVLLVLMVNEHKYNRDWMAAHKK